MEAQKLAAFYFPTRVLLVDDEINYLRSIVFSLSQHQATYELFADPVVISNYLTETYKNIDFIQNIVEYPEQNILRKSIDINLKEIPNIIYKPERFSEVSVLVTDFNMPKHTGQQLCENVKHLPIKKLMITSETDKSLAIRLLNKNIIDQFINKTSSPTEHSVFSLALSGMINELQQEYFYDLTEVIQATLMAERQPSPLKDPEFIKLFNRLVNENDICEYYLIDDVGSFLFVSRTGKTSYLLVKTEEGLETDIELIHYSDNRNDEALNKLTSKSHMFYWASENAFPHTKEEQLEHLYPNLKVGNYYYCYVKEKNVLKLDHSKIVSFVQYVDNLS